MPSAQPAVAPGFDDPVIDSQQAFRRILDAMAHPGRIVALDGPANVARPLFPATAALCLALVDLETPVWLDAPLAASEATAAFLRFHCGCPILDTPDKAAFAMIAEPNAMPSLDRFDAGSDAFPDRAATLLIQIPSLTDGPLHTLRGPGIAERANLAVDGLPTDFWDTRKEMEILFPRGLDILFVEGVHLVALPRSTLLEA